MKKKTVLLIALLSMAATCFAVGCGEENAVYVEGANDIHIPTNITSYDFMQGVVADSCDSSKVVFGTAGVYPVSYKRGKDGEVINVYIYGTPTYEAEDTEISYAQAVAGDLDDGIVVQDTFGTVLTFERKSELTADTYGFYEYGKAYEISYVATDRVGNEVSFDRTVTIEGEPYSLGEQEYDVSGTSPLYFENGEVTKIVCGETLLTENDYVARNGYLSLKELFLDQMGLNETVACRIEFADGYGDLSLKFTDVKNTRVWKAFFAQGKTEVTNDGLTQTYTSPSLLSESVYSLLNLGLYDKVSGAADTVVNQMATSGDIWCYFPTTYYSSAAKALGEEKNELDSDGNYPGVDMVKFGNKDVFAMAKQMGYTKLVVGLKNDGLNGWTTMVGGANSAVDTEGVSAYMGSSGGTIEISLDVLEKYDFAYIHDLNTNINITCMYFQKMSGISNAMYAALKTNATTAEGVTKSEELVQSKYFQEMGFGLYDKVSGAADMVKDQIASEGDIWCYLTYTAWYSGAAKELGISKNEIDESATGYQGVDMVKFGSQDLFTVAKQLGYTKLVIKVNHNNVQGGGANTSNDKEGVWASNGVIEISLDVLEKYAFGYVFCDNNDINITSMYFQTDAVDANS